MAEFVPKDIRGVVNYEIPVTYESGIATITKEDLDKFLSMINETSINPKTLMYQGDFAKDPVIQKYKYDHQIQYKLKEEANLLDSEGNVIYEADGITPKKTLFKQYLIRISEESDLADTGKYALFPIPMLQGNNNIYIAQDGVLDTENPVLKVEGELPDVTKTLNYELLEANTIFYMNTGELNNYEPGDIIYNTTDKVFKKLVETSYSTIYYDEAYVPSIYDKILSGDTVANSIWTKVTTFISEDNEGSLEVEYRAPGASLADCYEDGKLKNNIAISKVLKVDYSKFNQDTAIPEDEQYETSESDDSNVSNDPIDYIDLNGAFVELEITEQSWVVCDTIDTVNTYINQQTGTIWVKGGN